MPEVRARVLRYEVAVDRAWTAKSDRGGPPLAEDEAWTPEHLLLAGLVRCSLTSLAYHAKRAGIAVSSGGVVRGAVTRREEDGRYGLVEAELRLEADLDPPQAAEAARDLVAKAERDCFVGASLSVQPRYTWIVNGEELA